MKDYKSNCYLYFHAVMFMGSLYISMILTNWSAPIKDEMNWMEYQKSEVSQLIKVGSTWIAGLIYLWTLFAPRILNS